MKKNTNIHSIQFGHFSSFGDKFFKCLSIKLPNLDCMTISTYSKDINTIYMRSTTFDTLTILWEQREAGLLFRRKERNEGATMVIFVNSKYVKGAFMNQCCYKYQVDCENRIIASTIQEEQEIKELVELQKMKESPQADYDEKTSLLNSYTFVEIQCASINKLHITTNSSYYTKYMHTFYPAAALEMHITLHK